MLAALYFVHEAGVVHLDVKPQNVFIREVEGGITVKLGDFGFSTSGAELAGAPAKGTAEYISPEVAEGNEIDGRTDLWSLGIMLYQLLEGRCPFESASPVELLKRIISEEVPALRADLPHGSFLPGVISRLTSKNPARRPASVAELLTNDFLPRHDALVMRSLFTPHQAGFLGRESELRALGSLFDGLSGTTPAVHRSALVVGPEGIGKSRLLREFRANARAANHVVVELKGKPDDPPLAPLADAARLLEAELVSRGKPLVAALPQEAYQRLFLRISEKMPFLIVADDFHQFDEASRAVLTSLMLEPEKFHFGVVLSITDECEKELTSLPERMLRIDPEELERKDVEALFRTVFGETFAATEIVTRLYRNYGGNPALLMKAIGWIAETLPGEAIVQPGKLRAMAGELETLLARKLDIWFAQRWRLLRKEKQIFLELLSCFDQPPTMKMVEKIVPFRTATLHAIGGALRKQRYLAVEGDGDRLRIRHLALKEQLNRSAGGEQIHRSIAEALEGESGNLGWQDLRELARHFELCGEPARASSYYELAGDRASDDNESRPAAADAYAGALRCAGRLHADNVARISSKLSEAYLAEGAFQESIRVDELLFAQNTLTPGQAVEAHKRLGKSFSRLGNNVQALRHLESAIKRSTKESDLFDLQQEIVAIKIAEGFYDEAIRLSNEQRRLARKQPDAQAIGVVETDIGIALFLSGDLDASLGAFAGALAVYERAKNKTKIVDALNNIGNVLSGMNSYREALAKWNQAIELLPEQGPNNQRAQILNNIGIAHAKLREFDQAASCYESARELFAGLDSKSGRAFTSTNLGEVAFAAGAYELALRRWSEALALYEEMHDFTGVAQTLLAQAQIYLLLNDAQRAGEALAKVAEIRDQHEVPGTEALLNCLRGMESFAQGRYAEARERFERSERHFSAEGAFTGGIVSEVEMRLYAGVRKAESHVLLNEPERALAILRQLLAEPSVANLPCAAAEIHYVIATIETAHPDLAKEKALVRLMRAFELIEQEHVAEVTWKISYALGREFLRRGQREKGRHHLTNAGRVLDHFAAQFTDEALRRQYLSAESRAGIRAAVASETGLAGREP
jgi:tetratricopeptide (TPR) repeat protein